MNLTADKPRSIAFGRFNGMLQILRFNWPLYLSALSALALCFLIIHLLAMQWAKSFALCAAGCISFWIVSSLAASHWIYDLSELSKSSAASHLLSKTPKRWAALHAGFDEFSGKLISEYPFSQGIAIDLYDPAVMTEGSIKRARSQERQNSFPTVRACYRSLPLKNESVDALFLIFAAHEFRKARCRSELFLEVSRILSANGQLVIIEHDRDAANFVAFGPGFLHFQPIRRWIELCAKNGMVLQKRSKITPFVHLLVFASANPQSALSAEDKAAII